MIHSIYSVVPATIIDRWQLDKNVRENFERTTGILKTRKTSLKPSVMAHKAAIGALENIDKKSIKALIVVTQSAERRAPAMAMQLLEKLGLDTNIPAFDINQACSGYIYGLHIANSLLLELGDVDARALVITVDKLHISSSPTESLIFSDAATATVMSFIKDSHATFFNDPRGQEYLYMNHDEHLVMNGNKVFEYVTKTMPQLIKDHSKGAELLVPHQANSLMLQILEKRGLLPVLSSIDEFGNTSMNSIPLTLCHKKEDVLGIRVLLCGFGAGWSAAMMQVTINAATQMEIGYI